LFGKDRVDLVEEGILTPLDGNKLDFMEASKDAGAREGIINAMKGSRGLRVNRQVVVEGQEIEDLGVAEAEEIKGKWGVSLKKVQKNKKGEEFIFVDPKTGAYGELSRAKYLGSKFITITHDRKEGETLAEREQDAVEYDKHIANIRRVFGI
jgi:hypothetical protein